VTPRKAVSQRAKFIETAKLLECDDSPEAFDASLRALVPKVPVKPAKRSDAKKRRAKK
jgi:hypothetical protein